MVTLQARVDQVRSFVESCKGFLLNVYKAMYPLNDHPSQLSRLLRMLRSPENMKRHVCRQLIGGATVALAFVRVKNPLVNFHDLHKLPETDNNRVDFIPHYEAVGDATEKIVDSSNAETEWLLCEAKGDH